MWLIFSYILATERMTVESHVINEVEQTITRPEVLTANPGETKHLGRKSLRTQPVVAGPMRGGCIPRGVLNQVPYDPPPRGPNPYPYIPHF